MGSMSGTSRRAKGRRAKGRRAKGQGPSAESQGPSADLAASAALLPPQDQLDAAAAADPGYQAAMEQMLAPILAALHEGLTPEEILGRMDAWYPLLDDAALTTLLERGVAAADALGRLEVDQEQGGRA